MLGLKKKDPLPNRSTYLGATAHISMRTGGKSGSRMQYTVDRNRLEGLRLSDGKTGTGHTRDTGW